MPISSSSVNPALKTKINPHAAIPASLWFLHGILLMPVLMIQLTWFTSGGFLFNIIVGLGVATFSYFINRKNNSVLKALPIALAAILGAVWCAATFGPALLYLVEFVPISLMLFATMMATSLGAAFITWLLLRNATSKSRLRASLVINFGLCFMILVGCTFFALGPLLWLPSLSVGALLGFGFGFLVDYLDSNGSRKIFTSLYSVSGLLTGIMAGILLNSIILLPFAGFTCLILGAAGMLLASSIGFYKGGKYNLKADVFDEAVENNSELRQHLYQAVAMFPAILFGYQLGGILGFKFHWLGKRVGLLFYQATTSLTMASIQATFVKIYNYFSSGNVPVNSKQSSAPAVFKLIKLPENAGQAQLCSRLTPVSDKSPIDSGKNDVSKDKVSAPRLGASN